MTYKATCLARTLALTLALGLPLTGCTGASMDKVSWKELTGALVPTPPDKTSTDAKLSRYRGQTDYLNPSYNYRSFGKSGDLPSAALESSDSNGGAREIQESDVYKIGKAGSKKLYLLNNYRGLQVVDFSAGPDAPKLSARVPATGGHSDQMYSVGGGDALLSIEQKYSNNAYVSSLILFDIKNSTAPVVAKKVELEGTIRDSRLVGDVLYVAAVKTTNQDDEQVSSAYVASYKVSATDVTPIETHPLALKLGYQENMNIQEVTEAGKLKYYLLAVTEKQEWSWGDRSSSVEVVDITDPNGDITPVFSVSAKGSVRERSQTVIKDRTLIVTSNFRNKNNIAMVAVETFLLPEANSEYLTTLERDFRKIRIERELENAPQGTDLETLNETLLADAKLGLKGRFVQSPNGPIKLFADSVVTASDTTGLSASLQDVRVSGNLLYAFWVPVNMVDPLDVFDISAPRTGVKHLSRLQFEGWISRSFPMEYQGRKFILGLGFVRPAIDNEAGRQYPQAMLFEITQKNGKLAATEVAQTNLSTNAVWTYANFNEPDKMIEFRLDSAGAGEVLFSLYQSSDGEGSEGGKIIKFDLEAAIKGNTVFTEGPFLATGATWLKRMFTNTEISRINAFSDEELAVFGSDLNSIDSATMKAATVLELARNIQALVPFENGNLYAQVVDKSKGWWTTTGDQSTEIRITPTPDAESHEVKETLRLKGRFSSVNKFNENTLLVATDEYSMSEEAKAKKNEGFFGHYNDLRTVRLTKVNVGIGVTATTELLAEFTIQQSNGSAMPMFFRRSYYSDNVELLTLASGQRLLTTNDRIYALSTDLKKVSEVQLKCVPPAGESNLSVVSGQLVVQSSEVVEESERQLYMTRNSLALARLENDTVVCDGFVRVPGQAKLIKGKTIVMEDTWAESVSRKEYKDWQNVDQVSYEADTESGLTAVIVENGTATLVDQRVGEVYGSIETKDSLVIKTTEQNNQYYYGYDRYGAQESTTTIYTVGTDQGGFFTSQRVKTSFPVYASVELLNTTEGVLVIAANSGKLSVQRLNGSSLVPAKLRPTGSKESFETVQSLSAGWSNNYRFDEKTELLSNAAGYYGAEAFVLE